MSENKTTKKAFSGMLEQTEVNYIPLSTTRGKACAACRWFLNDGCFIVEHCEPEPIIATGYCDRFEATPPPPPEPTEVLAEAIAEALTETGANITNAIYDAVPTPAVSEASMMDMGKDKPKGKPILQRIREFISPTGTKDDAFSVFKGVDGTWHWHSIHTNNFEDLEGEILTEKAHDQYIERLDMGLVPMPVLQAWHTPGTEHGVADVVWRSGHFVHALGHFYDTPTAEKAIDFYRKNSGKIKMSHGFTAPEWAFDGKHYDDYNTIEVTTLPPYAAANPYTSFEELLAMQKDMSAEKRRYLEMVVGKDKVEELVTNDVQRGKALEDLRIAYKDHASTDAAPAAPTAAQAEDVNKALSVVYTDLVKSMDDFMSIVTVQAKAIKSLEEKNVALEQKHEAETQEWQKALDQLLVVINAPARRASKDDSTLVSDVEKDKLKDNLPTQDAQAKFFGVRVKE